MTVTGLDGRFYKWRPKSSPRPTASKGHLRCRELLKSLFPFDPVLEEVVLPGTRGLTADFYLPSRQSMLEINGRQHGEYVRHFHQSRLGFARSLGNDKKKAEWCRLNGIDLVLLEDSENDDVWQERILDRP